MEQPDDQQILIDRESRSGSAVADELVDELEEQRQRREADALRQKVKSGFEYMHNRLRVGLGLLVQTGAFSRDDLAQMLRAQVLWAPLGACPCESEEEVEDRSPRERPVLRRLEQSALKDHHRALPQARHRYHCPLYERGRRGDPLVPCSEAQAQRPEYRGNRWQHRKWTAPPGMDPVQAEAMVPFVEGYEDMNPCRLISQAMYQSFNPSTSLPEYLTLTPRAVPPPPALPAERSGDLVLRRNQQVRLRVLQRAAALEVEEERHRRELLQHLAQLGRLSDRDIGELIYYRAVVTDEGWLPCKDDRARTVLDPIRQDDRPMADDDDDDEDITHERYYCPLHARALAGDRTTPCYEMQGIVPLPDRVAEQEKKDRRHREWVAQRRAEGKVFHRGPEEDALEHAYAGPDDAPEGAQDIVTLLKVRPCYLIGKTLASYVYQYAEYVRDHPELFPTGSEDEPPEPGGPGE